MQELSVGTATVQSISRGAATTPSHPNDVKFKVQYSDGYKGARHMKDGSVVTISKESAAQFAKAGIGHVIDETKAAALPEVTDENVSEPEKESAEQFAKDSEVKTKKAKAKNA